MKTTGNTILITGGTSGIGRALAEAFHDQGNRVIVNRQSGAALSDATVVAVRPGPEIRDWVIVEGRQGDDRKIRRQQVAQVLGELAAKVRDVQQRPGQKEDRFAFASVAAHQPPAGRA